MIIVVFCKSEDFRCIVLIKILLWWAIFAEMMPLNHILRKYTTKYKLCRSQEKINHLMYMDDIKLFAKNEKELETLIHAIRIYSQDIRMEFGIEKCAMLVMKSGKRHTEWNYQIRTKLEHLEKMKPTNPPSNK